MELEARVGSSSKRACEPLKVYLFAFTLSCPTGPRKEKEKNDDDDDHALPRTAPSLPSVADEGARGGRVSGRWMLLEAGGWRLEAGCGIKDRRLNELGARPANPSAHEGWNMAAWPRPRMAWRRACRQGPGLGWQSSPHGNFPWRQSGGNMRQRVCRWPEWPIAHQPIAHMHRITRCMHV